MGVEVCPVHRSEFKSSDISSLNVVDMNADEPRGVKRSAEDEEEEEEEIRHSRPQTHNERKEWITDAVKKLNTHNLRQQVLVSNFVRSIHLDMERDGIGVPEMYDENNKRRGPYIPEWRPHRTTTLDPSPNSSINSSDVDSRPGSPSVISPTPHRSMESADVDFSADYERCFMETDSLKVSSFSRTFDRIDPSALWTEESDRLTRLNWCSVLTSSFNGSDSSTSDYISEDSSSSTNLHTLMPASTEMEYFEMPPNISSDCPTGSTSPISGTSPTSSEDEIFGDVDLTLYDFDCHAMSPPNVSMDPLSAEELVWSLSHDQRQSNSSDRDYVTSIST